MIYRPFIPGITVAGYTIRVFLEALRSFPVLRESFLEVLGVVEIHDHMWLAQEQLLLGYQKVDYLLGGRGLERFGAQVPSLVALPPELGDPHAVLAQLDAVFHQHHSRDGVPMLDPAIGEQLEGIGHYRYERSGEREAVIVADNAYPCRFDLGLCRGFAARFEPGCTSTHEPGSCRVEGDPSCTYRIRW